METKKTGIKKREDRFWKFFLVFIIVASFFASIFFMVESVIVEEKAKKGVAHTLFSEPYSLEWNERGVEDKELQSLIKSPVILGEIPNRAWENWSTNTIIQKSGDLSKMGLPVFKISYLSDYAELYLRNISGLEKKDFLAIEFTVYGEVKNPEELIIELVDKEGVGLGDESVFWYAPGNPYLGGEIRMVIPLRNLNAEEKIYGIRIARSKPGEISISDMTFTENPLQYPISPEANPNNVEIEKSVREMFPQYKIDFIDRHDDALNWKVIYGGGLITSGRKFSGLFLGNSEVLLSLFVSGFEWKDYKFNLQLNWSEIQGLSLYGRYVDEGNNVKCAFGGNGGYVAIYETVLGREELKSYTYTNLTSIEAWKDVSVGIEVVDNNIQCLKDGVSVLKYQSSKIKEVGTIGIGLWNSAGGGGMGNKIEITKLLVKEM